MHPLQARIVIVGAGFSGIGTAIRLRQRGITDFVVLERANEVGGTWRMNTYPGLKCDVPSHLYSLSFAPNPDWTHMYAAQPEILAYLQRTARDYGILPHVKFGCEFERADWDDATQCWRIQTSQGAIDASILIAGMGVLIEGNDPEIPGLNTFAGTRFHSSHWNHDHDLHGKRVAVIGTGASAIQFVPEIQRQVGHLDVFQRTPNWILPHTDRSIGAAERFAYRRVPGLRSALREAIKASHELAAVAFVDDTRLTKAFEAICHAHLFAQVRDPKLRRKLTPDYMFGCKRTTYSNTWYPALQQPNVELVTSSISEVTADGVLTVDGVTHPADTLILATGYSYSLRHNLAPRVYGRGGLRLLDTPQVAYRGTTATGFPNMFVMIGPNSGLGHNSMVEVIEAQIGYVLDALQTMQRDRIASFDVKPDVQAAYNDDIQQKLAPTVWNSGGCTSWYLDADGYNRAMFPGNLSALKRTLHEFDVAAYDLTPERELAVTH